MNMSLPTDVPPTPMKPMFSPDNPPSVESSVTPFGAKTALLRTLSLLLRALPLLLRALSFKVTLTTHKSVFED
jgi:hypothetical protein